MQSCGSRVKNKLSSTDQLGSKVSLKYRKEEDFGTWIGGLCSIVAMAVIGSYVVSEVYSLFFTPTYN